MPNNNSPARFRALGLPKSILKRIERFGFDTPTPIQERAIPPLLDGYDVIGIAQTGTGKTLAFAAPMIACLQPGDLGLVIAPTRELAHQIEETYRRFGVRSTLLVGGAPMDPQIKALKNAPDVVVATPGRLVDHIERRTIDLRCVAILVLDEADRMLDMGFAPAIKRIVADTPEDRQTMLFCATMPREIARMAEQYLYDPIWVEVSRSGETIDAIDQELIIIPRDQKITVLKALIRDLNGSVLVFTRTRHGARKLAKVLRNRGFNTAELHADRTLPQRRAALDGFKRGRFQILVATDIAARGIDVKDIGMVVNYDVPNSPEDYVHRIGRTGRAGKSGIAITLATPDQYEEVRSIEKLLRTEIPISDLSDGGFAAVSPKAARKRAGRPRQSFRKKRAWVS
ncbi:MAG: DEAD/DEAH box helicase [Armatimonadetes bacterium]|nr:DEAD/DEAH box helicase [Armatimonadota bacterium]